MADFVRFFERDLPNTFNKELGYELRDQLWNPVKDFARDVGLVDALKNSLKGASNLIMNISKLPGAIADNGQLIIIVVGIVGAAILASYVFPTSVKR